MRLLFLLAALALSAAHPSDAQPSAVSDSLGTRRGTAAAPALQEASTPAPDSFAAPVETTAEVGFLGKWGFVLILIGVTVLVSVVTAVLFGFVQRRAHDAATGGIVTPLNQTDPSRGRRPQTAPLPRPSVAVEPPARQSDLEALAWRVARLEQQAAAPAAPPALLPTPVLVPNAPSAPLPSASEAAAAAFAEWCRTGGGLVDRHELFQSALDGAVPGAAVEVVRRDLDSPARPVYFDGVGGNSAAAYWLVRAGGEALLFPQPQSPQQFRDLAPVFEGAAAPQTVRQVVPARVAASGGGHVLTQPGRIG